MTQENKITQTNSQKDIRVKMRNNAFLLALIMSMSLGITETNAYADEMEVANKKYSTTHLNLRSGPGTKYQRLTTIAPNTEVTIIEELTNGWTKILYNNQYYFCSKKYLKNADSVAATAEYKIPQTASPYDNKVVGESGTSQVVINMANDYWNKNIPNWLKEKYINSGWNLVISGIPLKTRFGYSVSIAGITDYEAKTIYVDNRKSPVNRGTISHEIGHFVDGVYNFPSLTNEFKELFQKEKNNFIYTGAVGDNHEKSNSMEYFASVFQDMITHNDRVKSQIPETYNFINHYINDMKNQPTQ